jgi:cysteinyl-tRNA synthetase
MEDLKLSQKQLNWYTCGPTVYNDAHLGHARVYITCDIIRRLLRDYFNIPITYAMNITNIDDKIIAKAKERYGKAGHHEVKEVSQ